MSLKTVITRLSQTATAIASTSKPSRFAGESFRGHFADFGVALQSFNLLWQNHICTNLLHCHWTSIGFGGDFTEINSKKAF
ncbi:hypothetical protein L484_021705 [Morus notabilis]|uniref:Uncharacterized protein n=1 Tax=Morus notabilis TaxID=981085 RepID=W9SVC5_9ROSA|nr:hypothetical protein L484_021705 [Morus notabilis]